MELNPQHVELLERVVSKSAVFMDALRAVRSLGLPHWVIGGGIVRNVVWDSLAANGEPTPIRDIDVAYFDAADLNSATELRAEEMLRAAWTGPPFQVRNQARVHLWYERRYGIAVEPFLSIEAAIASWPETVTAIGIRLEQDDRLRVYAPFGLDDLFGLVLRRNPARADRTLFQKRLEGKRIRETWPGVRVARD